MHLSSVHNSCACSEAKSANSSKYARVKIVRIMMLKFYTKLPLLVVNHEDLLLFFRFFLRINQIAFDFILFLKTGYYLYVDTIRQSSLHKTLLILIFGFFNLNEGSIMSEFQQSLRNRENTI